MADAIGDMIAGFETLDSRRPPQIPGLGGWCREWPKIHALTLKFLRDRGDEALDAGFECLEMLGVHSEAGAMRMDCTGFLITYRPVTVDTIAPKLITFSNGLVYRGRFNPVDSVPVWEFRAQAASQRKG